MLFLAAVLITADSTYREASARMPGQIQSTTPNSIAHTGLQTSFIFNGVALNLSKISLLVAGSQIIKQSQVLTRLIA